MVKELSYLIKNADEIWLSAFFCMKDTAIIKQIIRLHNLNIY